jgi:glycopeptide antibiotics resistance protein
MLIFRRDRTATVWTGVLPVWVGLILFSSTSLAGQVSDAALTRFVVTHIRRHDVFDLYHRWHVYFLAEKAVHITLFIVLALLLWRLLPDIPGKVVVVFLCGASLGCCSELVQSLFPDRDPAVRDVLINAVATAIGAAAAFFYTRRQRRLAIRMLT